MFVMSPNDNRVSDRHSGPKDGNFGGNRKVTRSNVQKAEDYTKPSLERRANVEGDAEEKFINPDATMDIDDLNDPNTRKRDASRHAETSTPGAQNQYRRPGDSKKIESDADNRPEPEHREDDVVKEPDSTKKHGSRNPWHFGESYRRPGDKNLAPDQQSN